jgi:hypothetical protein
VTIEGAAVVVESQGIRTPDRSHLAGAGWTPDVEDTSETERKARVSWAPSLSLSLSLSRALEMICCSLLYSTLTDSVLCS